MSSEKNCMHLRILCMPSYAIGFDGPAPQVVQLETEGQRWGWAMGRCSPVALRCWTEVTKVYWQQGAPWMCCWWQDWPGWGTGPAGNSQPRALQSRRRRQGQPGSRLTSSQSWSGRLQYVLGLVDVEGGAMVISAARAWWRRPLLTWRQHHVGLVLKCRLVDEINWWPKISHCNTSLASFGFRTCSHFFFFFCYLTY